MHANELREILERCENGTDDILSKNSKIIKSNKIDFDKKKNLLIASTILVIGIGGLVFEAGTFTLSAML